jgi:hypothetical protein
MDGQEDARAHLESEPVRARPALEAASGVLLTAIVLQPQEAGSHDEGDRAHETRLQLAAEEADQRRKRVHLSGEPRDRPSWSVLARRFAPPRRRDDDEKGKGERSEADRSSHTRSNVRVLLFARASNDTR